MWGGSGDDTIYGGVGADRLFGGPGDDTACGSFGVDVVGGGRGDDTVTACDGVAGEREQVYGGPGDDHLSSYAYDELLSGGDGFDVLTYYPWRGRVGATVDLAQRRPQETVAAGMDQLAGIEGLVGTGYDDTLLGDDGPNYIDGYVGADTIDARGGIDQCTRDPADTVAGCEELVEPLPPFRVPADTGSPASAAEATCYGLPVTINLYDAGHPDPDRPRSDVVLGTFGEEHLATGAGDDVVCGGRGDDFIDPGAGDDVVLGGQGVDTLNYRAAPAPVSIDLRIREPQPTGLGTDLVRGVEDVFGAADHPNRLFGTIGPNLLIGGEADDLIETGAGDDTVFAHGGDDLLTLGIDDDVAAGGNGDDRIVGAAGDDRLDGDGHGETGADVLLGGAGHDEVFGGFGVDEVRGGRGNDIVRAYGTAVGEVGPRELMYGGPDDDRLVVSRHDELVSGGFGIDVVDYQSISRDTDTAVAVDLRVTRPQDTGGGGIDQIYLVEGVVGSLYDDVLHGNDGPNTISGGYGGADIIDAHGGSDVCTEDPLDTFAGCEDFVDPPPFRTPAAHRPF